MGETAQILVSNFALIVACMLVLWLVSIPLKDVSFIDSFWPTGSVVPVCLSL
jgi:steroid 5-alpha reductase family enzyme